MQLLDGKKLSQEIKLEIAGEVIQIRQAGKRVPHLAAVLVGNNGASQTYVNSKIKTCKEVGIKSTWSSSKKTLPRTNCWHTSIC
jgi:methylenetetrahydrofolate dehydrogenase (NADP+)/methenyltetrahydrofolate cyclohydrolase